MIIRGGSLELLAEAKLTAGAEVKKHEYLFTYQQEAQFGQGVGFMKIKESQKGGLEIGHG